MKKKKKSSVGSKKKILKKKIKPRKKVAAKKKPQRKKKVVSVVSEEKMEELIKKTKSRGFVTFSEILSFFPNIEGNIAEVENMFSRFEKEGIELKDSRGYLDFDEKTPKK